MLRCVCGPQMSGTHPLPRPDSRPAVRIGELARPSAPARPRAAREEFPCAGKEKEDGGDGTRSGTGETKRFRSDSRPRYPVWTCFSWFSIETETILSTKQVTPPLIKLSVLPWCPCTKTQKALRIERTGSHFRGRGPRPSWYAPLPDLFLPHQLGLPAAALDFLPPLGRLLRPHETPAGRGATQ